MLYLFFLLKTAAAPDNVNMSSAAAGSSLPVFGFAELFFADVVEAVEVVVLDVEVEAAVEAVVVSSPLYSSPYPSG